MIYLKVLLPFAHHNTAHVKGISIRLAGQGYLDNNHMILQLKDCVDVLKPLYPFDCGSRTSDGVL
jgi:hypothetical protein